MQFPFNSKQVLVLTIFSFLGLTSCLFGLMFGGFEIEISKLINGTLSQLEVEVLYNIRSPRVFLAVMVGAALGVSGASLQGLFRNPLADPGLIGVSAGAALGAVAAIVLLTSGGIAIQFGHYITPLSAVLGSLLVIGVLFGFTNGFAQSGITYMLLVGIALNALATVGIGFLTFISTDSQLRGLTYWMMGSFGSVSWELLIPAIFVVATCIVSLIYISSKLDIMQLGEVEAYRVGINVKKVKLMVIILSAFMIGASVSLSGIIGFIGLVVPHLVRLLAGTSHTYLLIGSAILGGSITVFSDLFSRMVVLPAELPVGLATSALGAPFFLWLVLRMKKH